MLQLEGKITLSSNIVNTHPTNSCFVLAEIKCILRYFMERIEPFQLMSRCSFLKILKKFLRYSDRASLSDHKQPVTPAELCYMSIFLCLAAVRKNLKETRVLGGNSDRAKWSSQGTSTASSSLRLCNCSPDQHMKLLQREVRGFLGLTHRRNSHLEYEKIWLILCRQLNIHEPSWVICGKFRLKDSKAGPFK